MVTYGFLLYRHECFTRKYTTRKIHTKLHPGHEWPIFHILSSEDIISLILSLSPKLYLNSLVCDRNIFGLPRIRRSSAIFGTPRTFSKFSENVRERSSGIRNNFGKTLVIFRKWSKIDKNAVISVSI